MCDFILCALGQLFLCGNWIHRRYFSLESWIILVNEAYNCFTPFSCAYLTALTWVCKWDEWHEMCCISVLPPPSRGPELLWVWQCSKQMWKAQLSGLGVLWEYGELEWGEEGAVWFWYLSWDRRGKERAWRGSLLLWESWLIANGSFSMNLALPPPLVSDKTC